MMDPTLGTAGACSTHADTAKPATNPHTSRALPLALQVQEVSVRLYNAICSAIEAWAERTRTDTLEQEFDNADWSSANTDMDD